MTTSLFRTVRPDFLIFGNRHSKPAKIG